MNILIIGPSWVGDMVMAQVIFRQLKTTYPEAKLTVVAPSWCAPICLRMPDVDVVIETPITHGQFALLKRYQLGRSLRSSSFNWAIVIPNSWKSALIPFFAHIPRRTGYLGEARFGLLNDIRAKKPGKIVDSYLALSLAKDAQPTSLKGLPKLTVNLSNIDYLTNNHAISPKTKKRLALCFGAAFGPSKQWPLEYFLRLAEQLQDTWEPWFFGSANDAKLLNNLALPGRSFAGKLSLLETLDLLSTVDAVVCNDSGLMHMASSLNIPTIAIYGSTPSHLAPPLSTHKAILERSLPCRPCFKPTCPYGHHKCMRDITVEEVARTLEEVFM